MTPNQDTKSDPATCFTYFLAVRLSDGQSLSGDPAFIYISGVHRGRCTELLQHAEAFRARGRARSVYLLDAESRPMLPAARATEAMAEELLGWAAQMPIFATHLTGACPR